MLKLQTIPQTTQIRFGSDNDNLDTQSAESQGPRPFVKWVGGKRQLVEILKKNMPAFTGRYYEPFVGGGALLFAIKPHAPVISDLNSELINCYQTICDFPDSLIKNLGRHKNEVEYFYEMRAKKLYKQVERAGRFIYLNKTCFNGLYRENSKGQFNTPFGYYKNPNIVDSANVHAVSNYLRTANVVIKHSGYQHVLATAKEGDFVYFDPPYAPLTRTANFTGYLKSGFDQDDQKELAAVFSELKNRKVFVMLSNSNSIEIRELYKDHNIQEVYATRAINCIGSKRGKEANEVLITSY